MILGPVNCYCPVAPLNLQAGARPGIRDVVPPLKDHVLAARHEAPETCVPAELVLGVDPTARDHAELLCVVGAHVLELRGVRVLQLAPDGALGRDDGLGAELLLLLRLLLRGRHGALRLGLRCLGLLRLLRRRRPLLRARRRPRAHCAAPASILPRPGPPGPPEESPSASCPPPELR